eukprot:scaffold244763_cov30-Tisochrysis_lutea.AAC.3
MMVSSNSTRDFARAPCSPTATRAPFATSSDVPAAEVGVASVARNSLARSLTPSRCDSQRASRAAPDEAPTDCSTIVVRTSSRSSSRSSPRLQGARLTSALNAEMAVCC